MKVVMAFLVIAMSRVCAGSSGGMVCRRSLPGDGAESGWEEEYWGAPHWLISYQCCIGTDLLGELLILVLTGGTPQWHAHAPWHSLGHLTGSPRLFPLLPELPYSCLSQSRWSGEQRSEDK